MMEISLRDDIEMIWIVLETDSMQRKLWFLKSSSMTSMLVEDVESIELKLLMMNSSWNS